MGSENSDGTITPANGALYKLDRSNLSNPPPVISPVDISNGIAWNKANDKFYFIDTLTRKVTVYDYNDEEGTISNPRTVFDLEEKKISGYPDGMTIDEDDNLWIALNAAGSVIQVNPTTGKLLQEIAIPVRDVTSVMWGGPELDVLYVTTSRVRLTAQEKLEQPSAGSVFAVTNTGTKGLQVFNADIVDRI